MPLTSPSEAQGVSIRARRWSWFAALVLAATAGGHPGVTAQPLQENFYQPLKKKIEDLENKAGYTPTHRSYDKSLVPYGRRRCC